MGQSIDQTSDDIYRRRVFRARRSSVEQKLLAGGELFDAVRERMIWGIRNQFPDYSDQQVAVELQRRLAILRRGQRIGRPTPTR